MNSRQDAPQGQSKRSTFPRIDWETLAATAARIVLLSTIVYATWHYGGADSIALRNVSLLLAVATALLLTCRRTYRSGRSRLPLPLLILAVAWITLGTVQQTGIATLLPWSYGGIREIHHSWAQPGSEALVEAARDLSEDKVASEHFAWTPGSVHPEETRQSLVPFTLAAIASLLFSMLFNTTYWRRVLLIGLVANGTALAFWGIVQRAGDGQQILPGVENRFSDAMPLGSFIYKNAGAAALIPSLAAVLALWYADRSRGRRDSWVSLSSSTFSGTQWLQTRLLCLFSCALLMTTALAASLSRGAWVAAAIAFAGAMIAVRGVKLGRGQWIALATVAVIGVGILTAVGLRNEVRERVGDLSLESLFQDSRWPQWQDGWATAIVHAPTGSGLGTYGHATLPQQEQTRRSWFREAHNQYLEIFTESGLVGLALLLAAVGWFVLVVRNLLRRSDRESRCWGLVGLVLLLAGGIQSLFDFVLVIPANLMVYASLVAVAGTFDASTIRNGAAPRYSLWQLRWHQWKHGVWANSRLAWCTFAAIGLWMAYVPASQQVASDAALKRISLVELQNQPTQQQIRNAMRDLDQAIAQHPSRASLYLRRSHVHLAAYRLHLLESTADQRQPLTWEETQIEYLFAVLSHQHSETAATVYQGLVASESMRRELSAAFLDVATALRLHPLAPRTHLTGAMLAPLARVQVEPWLQRTARLSNNSPEMLYLNGLFAMWTGDRELALEQWHRSLSINHTFLEPIFQHSRQAFSPLRIAERLVPPNRPDLFLRLMELQRTQTEGSQPSETSYDARLAAQIIAQVQSSDSIEPSVKHATIAEISFRLGDYEAEARYWREALRLRTREADYRLRYSHSLYRLGRNEEALEQAILGQTLNPADARFQQVASLIRQRMRIAVPH